MNIFKELVDNKLVLEKIEEEGKNLNANELQDVKACVFIAANEYGLKDFEETKILEVEYEFDNIAQGKVDLILAVSNPITYPKYLYNKRLVVDWKTANRANLDSTWKKKYNTSWQWKIYSHFAYADYFQYRGISKTSGNTLDILLQVPEFNSDRVIEYLINLNLMRSQLMESAVWPKHMPYACDAYNDPCHFKGICFKDRNNEFSGYVKEPFHYTTSETFMLCPEKFRLENYFHNNSIDDSEGNRNKAVIFGSAFHAGMESIYRQLKERQNGR